MKCDAMLKIFLKGLKGIKRKTKTYKKTNGLISEQS